MTEFTPRDVAADTLRRVTVTGNRTTRPEDRTAAAVIEVVAAFWGQCLELGAGVTDNEPSAEPRGARGGFGLKPHVKLITVRQGRSAGTSAVAQVLVGGIGLVLMPQAARRHLGRGMHVV